MCLITNGLTVQTYPNSSFYASVKMLSLSFDPSPKKEKMKEDPIVISLAWSRDVKYYKSLKASSAEQKQKERKKGGKSKYFRIASAVQAPIIVGVPVFFRARTGLRGCSVRLYHECG